MKMSIEETRGNLRISVEDIGEGWSGEYDEQNQDDSPLLRFEVLVRDSPHVETEDGFADEDGFAAAVDTSYCTAVTSNAQNEIALAKYLARQLAGITTGSELRQECQRLSWVSDSELNFMNDR